MTAGELALVALWGAAVFLDQWPAAQTMASRPIVAGPVVGWILGAPVEGVLWGAALEAMFLGVLPMGAARYPDAGTAAIAGTVVALSGREAGLYPAGLAVAVAAGAGWVGERVGRLQRRWNGRSAGRVRERVAAGDLGAPGRAVAAALARAAALGALQTGALVGLGLLALRFLGGTPWVGPLPARAVAVIAAAAGAVAGLRIFGSLRVAESRAARGAALAVGLLAGAVLAWWG